MQLVRFESSDEVLFGLDKVDQVKLTLLVNDIGHDRLAVVGAVERHLDMDRLGE